MKRLYKLGIGALVTVASSLAPVGVATAAASQNQSAPNAVRAPCPYMVYAGSGVMTPAQLVVPNNSCVCFANLDPLMQSHTFEVEADSKSLDFQEVGCEPVLVSIVPEQVPVYVDGAEEAVLEVV